MTNRFVKSPNPFAIAIALAFSCCLFFAVAWADEESAADSAAAPTSEAATVTEAAAAAAVATAADEGVVAPSEEPAVDEAAAPDGEEPEEADASAASESSSALTSTSNANIVDPTQRADNSFIYDTSIGSLFDQASLYDNRIVQVEGEVIGDRIIDTTSPNHCWIELASMEEDDSSNISVWISKEQTEQIDRFGRYGVTGTHFQVRGIYHQACPDHEGLSDIHATASNVLAAGIDHPDELNPSDFSIPLLLVFIGVVLLIAFRFVRDRLR